MERQKLANAIMGVFCLGLIITTVGMFAASGLDQVGTAYDALYVASMVFIMLAPIAIALVAGPELLQDEQNQSKEEHDSSLL